MRVKKDFSEEWKKEMTVLSICLGYHHGMA